MKSFFIKLKEDLENSMIDRYGTDELSKTMATAALLLLILSWFPHLHFFGFFSLILMSRALYRCYSRNYIKRLDELSKYRNIKEKYGRRFSIYKGMYQDRKTMRYFRCNKCKVYIRVVKGKGNISITCPRCGNELIRKT